MTTKRKYSILAVSLGSILYMMAAPSAHAGISVQCPGDLDGSAAWEPGETQPPNTKCMHLSAGDGYVVMADGTPLYIFGFSNLIWFINY